MDNGNPFEPPQTSADGNRSGATDIPNPISLNIVAAIFLFFGVVSVLLMVESLVRGTFYFNIGFMCLPVAWGLSRRRPVWRMLAMIVITIGMVSVWIVGALVLLGHESLALRWRGETFLETSKWAGVLVLGGMFVALFWMYRILIRRDIKQLFDKNYG